MDHRFGERLRLSVHYASTPALNVVKANSVEENSVTSSDDFELSNVGHQNYQTPSINYNNNNNNTLRKNSNRQRVASVSSSRLSTLQSFPIGLLDKPPPPAVPPKPKKKEVHHQHRVNIVVNANSQSEIVENLDRDEAEDNLNVSPEDVRAIETCYRGNKTQFVYVCESLANLYKSSARATSLSSKRNHLPNRREEGDWQLAYTGIPVLILQNDASNCTNSHFYFNHNGGGGGSKKNKNRKKIQILLVEKGSCFVLWRDVVDNLSNYMSNDLDHLFQTMHTSADHSSRIGLSFDSVSAATAFFSTVLALTADPKNISLNAPNLDKAAGGKKKPKQKQARPKKAEISLPCGFQHVVNVGRDDSEKYFSMQAYVGSNNSSRGNNARAKLTVIDSSGAELNF